MNQIIFSGNEKKIKQFRKRTWKYIIALFIVSTPFLVFVIYETLNGIGTFFDRDMLFLYFGAFMTYFIFLSFATLPQNFEIRENGILLPLRRWRDVLRKKERFIEYKDIFDIKFGNTPAEHKLVLKNGKEVALGAWGGFFLFYGISPNMVGKMDRILKKIREELIKYRDYDGDVLIKQEVLEKERNKA